MANEKYVLLKPETVEWILDVHRRALTDLGKELAEVSDKLISSKTKEEEKGSLFALQANLSGKMVVHQETLTRLTSNFYSTGNVKYDWELARMFKEETN